MVLLGATLAFLVGVRCRGDMPVTEAPPRRAVGGTVGGTQEGAIERTPRGFTGTPGGILGPLLA